MKGEGNVLKIVQRATEASLIVPSERGKQERRTKVQKKEGDSRYGCPDGVKKKNFTIVSGKTVKKKKTAFWRGEPGKEKWKISLITEGTVKWYTPTSPDQGRGGHRRGCFRRNRGGRLQTWWVWGRVTKKGELRNQVFKGSICAKRQLLGERAV